MVTRYQRETSNFDRALALVDAVYGFSLTLLITTIDITDRSAWLSLGDLLAHHGSELLSFAISFVVIVAVWRQNHALVGRFTALDPPTIVANLVAVGLVVFIPFTTEALGQPDLQNLPLPIALYAVNVGAAVLANIVLYQLGLARGLVVDDEPPRARWFRLADDLVVPVVMFASVPVTYLAMSLWGDPSAGMLVWLLPVVLGPVSGRLTERYVRKLRRGDDNPPEQG